MDLLMNEGARPASTAISEDEATPPLHGGSGQSLLRRYFGVLFAPQSYLNLAYLLLGMPLGTAYFVILVTLIATGGGMAITIVGIPLLIASVYGWCALAGFERVQTNVLLGTAIPPLVFNDAEGAYWRWPRVKSRLGNPLTWRALVLLFLRFPHGLATFAVAVALVSLPIGMIGMPLLATLGGGSDFLYYHVDTAWEGALFVLPGILLLPLSFRLMNLIALWSGRAVGSFLGSPQPAPARSAARVDSVAESAMTWGGLSFSGQLSPMAARTQSIQLKVYAVHAALFVGISVLLIVINGAATPDTWWAAWPIWGISILFAAHTGYLARGFFGLHLVTWAVVSLGLFVIDATYSGGRWFFYPVLAWGALVAAHGYGAKRLAEAAVQRAQLGGPAGESSATLETADECLEPPPAGPISVDVAMRIVTVGGQRIDVTPKEFDLLVLFVQNPGRPFSREDLLERIWKNDYEVTDRTIDTHVQRLRKKLGDQAEAIQTVWGVGYRFAG